MGSKKLYRVNILERLYTLTNRERKTRFSGGIFGYLWAFITPVFWIGLVAIAFSFLGKKVPIFTDPIFFVATGILPYAIFRQTITSIARSYIANRYLQYFTETNLSEVGAASAILEAVNSLVTSFVIFGSLFLILDIDSPANILKIIQGILLAWFLGASFGTLVAVIGRASDTFARAVPVVLRPLFWISGIFYIAAELPQSTIKILSYNPLFHVIEIIREGFFYGYNSLISDMYYPLISSLIFFIIAGVIDSWVRVTNRVRHRI
jgi:capsular polysaccharide transport system permease protein